MFSLQELMALSFDTETYLIGPELLPEGGKLFLAAAEKTGKSFLLLNAALDMAAGRHLWNGPFPIPRPLRVLYLDKELGPKRLKKRLATMVSGPLLGGSIFFESKNSKALLTEEGYKLIIELALMCRADVIIYDPLVKFYPGLDENSTADMSMAMYYLDIIMKHTGTTTIVAHHLSKPNVIPKKGAQRMRGSSALAADLDTYIEATRLDAAHHKTRNLRLSFVTRDEPVDDQYIKLCEEGGLEYLGTESPMKRGGGRPKKKNLPDYND